LEAFYRFPAMRCNFNGLSEEERLAAAMRQAVAEPPAASFDPHGRDRRLVAEFPDPVQGEAGPVGSDLFGETAPVSGFSVFAVPPS
jgi:hypothetical protein